MSTVSERVELALATPGSILWRTEQRLLKITALKSRLFSLSCRMRLRRRANGYVLTVYRGVYYGSTVIYYVEDSDELSVLEMALQRFPIGMREVLP